MTHIRVEPGPDGIVTLTLARPERGNAFDSAMRADFTRRLQTYTQDATVRAVVLRAQGKHFCAGSDMSAAGSDNATTRLDMLVRLDALPKPTIAFVQGGCIGAGVALAACCDIVFAAPDAFFSIPEVRLGISPHSLTPFLLRALGERGLRRYGLSGERFDANEAMRLGLVHEICAVEQFDAKQTTIVNELLSGAPGAIARLKGLVATLAAPDDHTQALALAETEPDVTQLAESREGIASFREKRPPHWAPKAINTE